MRYAVPVSATPAKSYVQLSAEHARLQTCGISPAELRLGPAWFDWVYTHLPYAASRPLRLHDVPVVYDPTEKEFRFV